MASSLDQLGEALRQVQRNLRHIQAPWLVGGSCGLLIQGVALQAPPRDLDIYADRIYAAELHEALKPYSVDEQLEDASGMYRSILSHYAVAEIKVELVCGFEVRAEECVYKVEAEFLANTHLIQVQTSIDSSLAETGDSWVPALKLMPLEHELLFNLLRSRADRYQAIAEVMRSRHRGMTRAMLDLIERNSISPAVVERIHQLLA